MNYLYIAIIILNIFVLVYLIYNLIKKRFLPSQNQTNLFLCRLFDSLEDIIVLFDKNKKIVFLNKNFESILGYDINNYFQKDYTFITEVISVENKQKFNNILKNSNQDTLQNLRIIHKNNSFKNFNLIFIPLQDTIFTFNYILILKDITNFKELELSAVEKENSLIVANEQFKKANDELQYQKKQYQDLNNKLKIVNENLVTRTKELLEANEELSSLDEMKNNILSTISHELRTPLVSIRGYSEWILSGRVGPVTSAMEKGLKISIKNVDKLVSLIDELLTLSKPFDKKREIHIQNINLIDIITEAIDIQQPNLQDNKIMLKLNYPQNKDIIILADKDKIIQVILNLITNAVKFNKPSGKIIIDVSLTNISEVKISVSDTGIGISQEHYNKIFQKFYQVDSKLTKKFSGLGIGLTIVKDIVEYHKGSVSIDSELGSFTTVNIILPVVKVLHNENVVKKELVIDIPKILVIEDEHDIAEYIKLLLEHEGYAVIIVTKPTEENILNALSKTVSLILLDIVMPEMNGFKVCELIKSKNEYKDIPIVVVSGKSDIKTQKSIINNFNIKDFIKKPFNIEKFIGIIKKYV